MATINAGCSNGHHNYVLNVSLVSQDLANNKSTINYNIRLDGNDLYNWTSWGNAVSCTYVINGVSRSFTVPQWGSGYYPSNGVTIQSGTMSINHESDGSKIVNFSLSASDSSGQSYMPGSASGSSSLTLPTIPVSNIRVKVGDTWTTGKCYVLVNGVWKEGKPYIKINGNWRESI